MLQREDKCDVFAVETKESDKCLQILIGIWQLQSQARCLHQQDVPTLKADCVVSFLQWQVYLVVYFILCYQALEKQGAEKAQQKAQERGFMNTAMNTGFNRGGRGGGGPVRGGAYLPGHSRKPYEKPVHAVQQPSLSGPIGAKDFATYPEPLIGK